MRWLRREKPKPTLRYWSVNEPMSCSVSGALSGWPSLSRALSFTLDNRRSNQDRVTPTSQSLSNWGERWASAARLLAKPTPPSARPTYAPPSPTTREEPMSSPELRYSRSGRVTAGTSSCARAPEPASSTHATSRPARMSAGDGHLGEQRLRLGRQLRVSRGDSARVVRPQRQRHLAPADVDVRVVILRLGQLRQPVHEFDTGQEIGCLVRAAEHPALLLPERVAGEEAMELLGGQLCRVSRHDPPFLRALPRAPPLGQVPLAGVGLHLRLEDLAHLPRLADGVRAGPHPRAQAREERRPQARGL